MIIVCVFFAEKVIVKEKFLECFSAAAESERLSTVV